MSLFHQNILAGASGAAGGASGPLYVDDVFSTHLYKGNGSSQQITNGIDLAGEGGLLWTKIRGSSGSHALFDSERGTGYSIYTDSSSSQDSRSDISSFNSDGFTLGIAGVTNTSNDNFCSWTFRKAPGFFDIVTYSGNSTSGRQISHNLGSVPGFIIIKALNDSRHFWCFHRSLGNTMAIPLSTNGATTTAAAYWNNTTPTDTVFTLGNDLDVNASGTNYVAYVFAHDDQSFGTDEDEAIIKCDQYTGNGSTDGPEINLGFEPQWVMIKARDESGSFRNWGIFDNMRGVIAGTGDKVLAANLPTQEDSGQNSANRNFIEFLPTGFKLSSEGLNLTDNSGNRYIYIAIRRPHKPPGAGTDVFNVTTTAINTNYTTGLLQMLLGLNLEAVVVTTGFTGLD